MLNQENRVAQSAREMQSLVPCLTDMRIVALDLEYGDGHRGFAEIGMAICDRGTRRGRQIVVGDHRPLGDFLHGRIERMSVDEACLALADEVGRADILAGHDLSGDRLRLREMGIMLPHVPVYDTARMSKRLFVPPLQAQMRAMLQLYGISTDGLHVAGNDAWSVIDLLIEMARQGPSPCAGPNGDYAHPRGRVDVLRDRRTADGYVTEPGG